MDIGHIASYNTLGLLLISMITGVIVGITGMGGGALLTPALILFGVPPGSAIANDLVAASVTKGVAATAHWRTGRPHLAIAMLLIVASVPAAALGGWLVWHMRRLHDNQEFLRIGIGILLLVVAATYVARVYIRPQSRECSQSEISVRVLATLSVGTLGGLLVGMTSIGSGSVMLSALILLYPAMGERQLVGTDLVQSVPLVTAAALSHLLNGGVSANLLLPLIIGGPFGSHLGSKLSSHISAYATRIALVAVLSLTGALMLHMSTIYALIVATSIAAILLLRTRMDDCVTRRTERR